MGLTRPRAHQLQGSDYKQSVRALSSTNVTLSGGAPATVDGVSLIVNDRILVTGQTDASQNGLYRVQSAGTGSNGTWTRTQDGDSAGDITAGMTVMVTEGTVNGDTQWKLTTDDPITIGTTDLNFEQASSYSFGTINVGGANLVADKVNDTFTVSAGNNIVLNGNATSDTFTVAVSNTPNFNNVSFDNASVTGNIVPSANITYDLGTTSLRWRDLYLSGSTIDIGGTKVSVNNDGDVEFKDSSNNPKKIIASEIEIGIGANKVKIQRGDNGRLKVLDENDSAEAVDLSQNSTDDLSEGSTNLYYTDAKVTSYLSNNNISVGGNAIIQGETFVHGNIVPNQDEVYNIGSPSYRFKEIYLSGNTIDLGGTRLSADNGTLLIDDAPITFSRGVPGDDGNKDLATGGDNVTLETPFEDAATDAFGVPIASLYDCMDPEGSILTVDYGEGEANVGA